MSKLRKKLQQARHEYQHQQYPGDLAADVLSQLAPAKKSHWVRNFSLAASLALAATAGIVIISQIKPEKDVAIVTEPHTTEVAPPATQESDTQPPVVAVDEGTDLSESIEEVRWSLVPSQIASSQETSFSLVPSLSASGTESVEDETVDQ
jgi:hypothetical protein